MKPKKTKQPSGYLVTVKAIPVTRYVLEYICPVCHTNFVGVDIGDNTISFRCDCGALLIIDK